MKLGKLRISFRAVIMLSHEFQNIVLQYVANNKLSVRQTETLVREKKYFSLENKSAGKMVLISNVMNHPTY